MGLCRRYTSNRDEAKDILQDTFIKIFSKIGQISDAEKLESWMKTIAVHTALDHYRKKKIIPLDAIDDIAADQPAASIELPGDEILMQMVNQLPDGCRVVFNLFVIDGYSHAEIATALGISEGTSRSQLNYAKTVLKHKLKCHDVAHYYEKFA